VGERPPARVEQAVWTRVAGVRRVLTAGIEAAAGPAGGRTGAGAAGPGLLVWQSDGYVLRVEPDQVDLLRFRRLARAARRRDCPDPERMVLLGEALRLWRGVPLAGLAGEWAGRQRDSWRLERLDAAVAWAAAALRLDRHAEVIPVLRGLVEEHPLSEPLAVALVRGLAADGQRAAATAECAAISERLTRELGTTPGRELRFLRQALVDDRPLPAGPAPVVPAQLPGDVRGFAGRGEHLARLDALLAGAPDEQPKTAVISAVSGTAGVGKTALAVRWAHRVADQFPDGRLYVNLRGFDPGGQIMAPAEAVRGFLDALGVPAARIPAGLDAQVALYRSVLAGKRVLVVLDNARDAEQARPLLPATPTARAVVTSRNQLTGLVAADGAHPIRLDLLTAGEARELLARRLGPSRAAAEPEAVEQIIAACARLPLALAIAAARAQQSSFPLTTLAAELTQAGRPLEELDAGDTVTQVRAVFSWSYTALTPAAARLFRLLGLHPGPDISAAAAASLAGTPPAGTRRLLAELTSAGLLSEHAPRRYGFHDLLAAYAADLVHDTDPDEERRAAATRLLDHYTHTAHTAARLLFPARDPIAIPLAAPAAGAAPEPPADLAAALAWLTAEHPVLLAAQRLAAGTGFDTRAWQLAWALDTFLSRQGHWPDLAGAWRTALAAADRLGNVTASAFAHRGLGWANRLLGDHDEAHIHLRRALDLGAEAGDQVGQAHTHRALSVLWEWLDRPDRAIEHAAQALDHYQAAGHRQGQAEALNSLGWYHAMLGDHAQALTACQQALTRQQQIGDRNGEAATWDSLGYVHHHLGQDSQAVDCYQHALTLYRDLGDRHDEASTLARLGDTHHAAGRPDAARTAWAGAVGILTDLDHPDAVDVRAKLDGSG